MYENVWTYVKMYKLYLNVMEYIRQMQRNVWKCKEMYETV